MSIKPEDMEVIFDFHVFDVQDFDLMIRHPIEKLLLDALTQSKLDVLLVKEAFSVLIARATNTMTEPSLILNRSKR